MGIFPRRSRAAVKEHCYPGMYVCVSVCFERRLFFYLQKEVGTLYVCMCVHMCVYGVHHPLHSSILLYIYIYIYIYILRIHIVLFSVRDWATVQGHGYSYVFFFF